MDGNEIPRHSGWVNYKGPILMRLCLAVSLLCAAPMALAQTPAPAPASRSAPAAQPILDTIPAARDIPYPGTIRLEVDASDSKNSLTKGRSSIEETWSHSLRMSVGASGHSAARSIIISR